MQSQIYSYLSTSKGTKLVTIFGYATRGVPGVEVNGIGKMGKNIKEKIIYLTRSRNMKLPTKRFVINIELNDIDFEISNQDLKHIEFPLLLLFWYLAGFIPIKKLDDCISGGFVNTLGQVYQGPIPKELDLVIKRKVGPVRFKSIKHIGVDGIYSGGLFKIQINKLLEHIPNLEYKKDYIDKLSATPLNSSIA